MLTGTSLTLMVRMHQVTIGIVACMVGMVLIMVVMVGR